MNDERIPQKESEQSLLRQMEQLRSERERVFEQFCTDTYNILANPQLSTEQRDVILSDIVKTARAKSDRYFSEVDVVEGVRLHSIKMTNARAQGTSWTRDDMQGLDRRVIDTMRSLKLRDGDWNFNRNWNNTPEAAPYVSIVAEVFKIVKGGSITQETKHSFDEVLANLSRRAPVGGFREQNAWFIKSSTDLLLSFFEDAPGLSEQELKPRIQHLRDQTQHLMKLWEESSEKIHELGNRVRKITKGQ